MNNQTQHMTLGPSLHESASYRFSSLQKKIILTILLVITGAFFISWHITLVVLITLITLVYFSDLFFNFYLIMRSYNDDVSLHVTHDELNALDESHLPTYTILCPLYKETAVLDQFIDAMAKLDYPSKKLHILLLLEDDDRETIAFVARRSLPKSFQTVIIPNSFPKTKPKALNIGLEAIPDSEYCVIYDAEDVPDRDQLKKAVIAFRKLDARTICLQAKLDFYNPAQNKLTRVFTAEYSMWFNLVLVGLQSIGAPIPLGGTSNHFRTKALRALRGWDPFNVTEDCDLGMRLFKNGYKTAILDATTFEEANSDISNWITQRTRWIKGYMQTYFVHMRDPRLFMSEWRKPHLLTFQLTVGGKILSMFINPLMWLITLSYFILRPFVGDFIHTLYPGPILYLAVASLIFGNFLYLYYYMVGCVRRGYDGLLRYTFLIPLYWLGISYAASIAAFQIFRRPFYWSKTRHGLHLKPAAL